MADLTSALLAGMKQKTYAQRLAEQATSTAPAPGGWGEALARALQGGMAGYMENQDNQAVGNEMDKGYGASVIGGVPQQPSSPGLGQRLGAMLGFSGQPAAAPAPAASSAPALGAALGGSQPTSGPRVYNADELSPIDAQVANPQQRMAAYGPTIEAAAKKQGIDPQMFARQLMQESKLNPMAVSKAGAMGIGQIMPGTASDLGVTDPHDPEQSINGAASYMRQNLDKFGNDPKVALAAYNWGPTRTQQWQAQGGDPSKLPAETQGYIKNIAGTDPAALPPNATLTQGGPLPQAQPAQRVAPSIPADVYARARAVAMRDGQAAGEAILAPYNKPADQEVPVTDPAERTKLGIPADDKNAYQRNSATGKITAINPQPFAVNVNNQNQSAFEKSYGEAQSKRAIDTLDAGDKAANNLQNIQLMRGLMSNVKTGKLTPMGATMGSWLASAGIDPKTVGIDPALPANAEAIASLSNKMALANIGGAGGIPANNFSEADRKFVTTLVPGLAQQPGANDILLTVAERSNQIAAEKADKWAAAREAGTSYEKFESTWRKELGQKNIFGDLAEKAKTFGSIPAAPASGGAGQPGSIIKYDAQGNRVK